MPIPTSCDNLVAPIQRMLAMANGSRPIFISQGVCLRDQQNAGIGGRSGQQLPTKKPCRLGQVTVHG